MKVLLIFKGECYRTRKNIEGEILGTNCIINWKRTLFDDLKNNNIDYDIALFTYKNHIFDEFCKKLKPNYVQTDGFNSQGESITEIKKFILNQQIINKYDRIVILRCDQVYRKNITKWNHWNDHNGILMVNRDVTWPSTKYCADIVFVIDNSHIIDFIKCNLDSNGHILGTYCHNNNIKHRYMYSTYHHFNPEHHPLHDHGYDRYIDVDLTNDTFIPKEI
jgi:hypothetical protein